MSARALAVVGVLALGSVSASAQMSENEVKDRLWRQLPRISSSSLRNAIAEYLGLRTLGGKPLMRPPRIPANFPRRTSPTATTPQIAPTDDFDHIVSGDPVSIVGLQTGPSVAVNPIDPNIVVVVGVNSNSHAGNESDCSMYVSLDGGISYAYARDLPIGVGSVTAPVKCQDPVVRFSPDGQYLYVAYGEASAVGPIDTTIWLKSYNGLDPMAAEMNSQHFDATSPDSVERPWLAVHTFDTTNVGAGYVYLTYVFHSGSSITEDILFARFSSVAGTIDIPPTVLASSGTSQRVLKAPRPAAGPQLQVLVCWFDAGPDGYSTSAQGSPPAFPTPVAPLNKFNIACRTSNDRGLTFAGDINPPESVTPADPTKWLYAAKNVANEVSAWLGPGATFFDISASQFPALTIDHKGNAHIVFGYNPGATNRFKIEQGNVAYVRSVLSAPTPTSPFLYPKWIRTNPAMGFGGQLFPTVVAQQWFDAPRIYIGWVDTSVTRTFGVANANVVYNVRYRRSANGGATFGAPVTVSDHWSVSPQETIGDYIDSTANNGMFHIAWSDNRFATDITIPRQHLYSDRN